MITEEQKKIVVDCYTWVAEHTKKLIDSIATAQVSSSSPVGLT